METIMWIARDEDETLCLYDTGRPLKLELDGVWNTNNSDCFILSSELFPEVKWEDDQPRKVRIVLEEE